MLNCWGDLIEFGFDLVWREGRLEADAMQRSTEEMDDEDNRGK